MKTLKLFSIILIFVSFTCSGENNKNSIKITIKRNTINHNPIGNKINVIFKNISSVNSYIWLMSCDYTKNFTINNKKIIFPNFECDKNIPKRYLLKPLEEKKIVLYITYGIGLTKQNFKIGFLNISGTNKGFSFNEEYKNTKQIVWSNQMIL